MKHTPTPNPLSALISALEVLPNVGPKTAQRMAYHLLQHQRQGAQKLQHALENALKNIHHCQQCNTLCENEQCALCCDPERDPTRLMIVHMPIDVASMEDAHCHDGYYFVLMGQINPLQNMDTHSISLPKLLARLENSPIEEIIIATNFTSEGDATAHVLHELLKNLPYRLSRLSRGMPLGSELEYIDAGTLAQAVYERRQLK